ncbi:hypothetical protein NC651_015117 [Populus alba x Populus x berolinensis]|nr:hypothetical protein NC651_015117 [Populus alba x Populus x berolinensis]
MKQLLPLTQQQMRFYKEKKARVLRKQCDNNSSQIKL